MFSSLLTSLITLSLIRVSLGQVYGVDNSQSVDEGTYSKALGEGFTHLVIRGYEEACSIGGQVDPNFVSNYNNAVAVGYTDIDTYWFPCTGSGNPCKSYDEQLIELGNTFFANSMNIGTIWVDLEVDSSCGTWDYGTDGNLEQAQAIVASLQNAGYNFGIYSSPGEWGNIFGSQDVVLDSSVPLWFATYDDNPTLDLSNPFGGWTSAYGKQYSDQSASGDFDLDYFAS
jgi:hypothetical protein